jgi:hypothetical protein
MEEIGLRRSHDDVPAAAAIGGGTGRLTWKEQRGIGKRRRRTQWYSRIEVRKLLGPNCVMGFGILWASLDRLQQCADAHLHLWPP